MLILILCWFSLGGVELSLPSSVLSRTDPDDDVVDVTSLSALDVVGEVAVVVVVVVGARRAVVGNCRSLPGAQGPRDDIEPCRTTGAFDDVTRGNQRVKRKRGG